jgi:hypothetical protein
MARSPTWFVIAALAAIAPAGADYYSVDSAELREHGHCAIDAWYAATHRDPSSFNLDVGCHYIPNLDLSLDTSFRRGDAILHEIEFQTAFRTPGPGPGVGLVAGAEWEDGRIRRYFAHAPITARVRDGRWALHANLGWAYDRAPARHLATWGVRSDLDLSRRTELIVEVFGAEREESTFQGGLRLHPSDRVFVDLGYGRELRTRGASWYVIGARLQF